MPYTKTGHKLYLRIMLGRGPEAKKIREELKRMAKEDRLPLNKFILRRILQILPKSDLAKSKMAEPRLMERPKNLEPVILRNSFDDEEPPAPQIDTSLIPSSKPL